MIGNYKPVHSDNQMISYIREAPGETRYLALLNLSHKPCYYKASNLHVKGKVVIATFPEMEGTDVDDNIILGGDEGVVVRLD